MSVNVKVLAAFTGKTNPLWVTIKGTSSKVIIDFGEIKLPKSVLKVDNFKELEEKYDCVIRGLDSNGMYISIIPKIVLKFMVLCSASDNHTRALSNWFKEKGAELIRVLLGK